MISNKLAIDELRQKYSNRFFIEDVQAVHQRLKDKAHDENHRQKINDAFRNATWGNPAIASDVYRAIGMYFGIDRRNAGEGEPLPQLTYCDVDTFIGGMDSKIYTHGLVIPPSYQDLIQALFGKGSIEKFQEESFVLFENLSGGNDLMKLVIRSKEEYWSKSMNLLESMTPPTKETQHLDFIQTFKDKTENMNTNEKEKYFRESFRENKLNLDDVIIGTGPDVYKNDKNSSLPIEQIHDYPLVSAISWSPFTRVFSMCSPIYFDTYINIINSVRWMPYFVEEHPYFMYAKQYLKNNFGADT